MIIDIADDYDFNFNHHRIVLVPFYSTAVSHFEIGYSISLFNDFIDGEVYAQNTSSFIFALYQSQSLYERLKFYVSKAIHGFNRLSIVDVKLLNLLLDVFTRNRAAPLSHTFNEAMSDIKSSQEHIVLIYLSYEDARPFIFCMLNS